MTSDSSSAAPSLERLIEKHARVAVLPVESQNDAYQPTPYESNALKNMRHILRQFALDHERSLVAENQHLKRHEDWAEQERDEIRAALGLMAGGVGLSLVDEVRAIVARAQKAEAEIQQLKEELETFGIVEIAVRNPNVASYVDHWEGRALSAEAKIQRLTDALKTTNRERVGSRMDSPSPRQQQATAPTD